MFFIFHIYIFTYAQFVTYMYMYRGISESNGQSVYCSVVFIGPCYCCRFNLQSFVSLLLFSYAKDAIVISSNL